MVPLKNIYLLLAYSHFFPFFSQSHFSFQSVSTNNHSSFLLHFLQFSEIDESSRSAHDMATPTRVEVHVFNMLEAGYSLLLASFPFSYWTIRHKWKCRRSRSHHDTAKWVFHLFLSSKYSKTLPAFKIRWFITGLFRSSLSPIYIPESRMLG